MLDGQVSFWLLVIFIFSFVFIYFLCETAAWYGGDSDRPIAARTEVQLPQQQKHVCPACQGTLE